MQQLSDEFAIEALLADLAYFQDDQDVDGLVSLFHADGSLEVFGPGEQGLVLRVAGRVRIAEATAGFLHGQLLGELTRLHVSGIRFNELRAERARIRSIFLITDQSEEDPQPRPTMTGVFDTECRLGSEGWRIWRHRIFPDQPLSAGLVEEFQLLERPDTGEDRSAEAGPNRDD